MKDLASAITVAESLIDFKGSSDGADKNKNSKGKNQLHSTWKQQFFLNRKEFLKIKRASDLMQTEIFFQRVVGSGKEFDESEAADTTGELAESLSFLTSCYILILWVDFRRSSCCWLF